MDLGKSWPLFRTYERFSVQLRESFAVNLLADLLFFNFLLEKYYLLGKIDCLIIFNSSLLI